MDATIESLPGLAKVILHRTSGLGIQAHGLLDTETCLPTPEVFFTLALGDFVFSGRNPSKLVCVLKYCDLPNLMSTFRSKGLTWRQ